MDTTFAVLACCLLAFHFAVAQKDKGNTTVTPTLSTNTLNQNKTTMMPTTANSTTSHATVISDLTENTTPFDSKEAFTKTIEASTESTSHPQTIQSTTITTTPLTSHTSLTTGTPGTNTPTFTALTTPLQQTTGVHVTSPDTTVTKANSTHSVNPTSDSKYSTTHGLGLNKSEMNMTIIFSIILGLFAVVPVVFLFYKYKHNIQYLHQPLTNTDATDAYVADEDTLVISGGLYDGHPIYDNVPTPPEDQSQFRLEFLH